MYSINSNNRVLRKQDGTHAIVAVVVGHSVVVAIARTPAIRRGVAIVAAPERAIIRGTSSTDFLFYPKNWDRNPFDFALFIKPKSVSVCCANSF